MERVVARSVGFAKALLKESAVAQAVTAALRLIIVVPAARVHSESAMAVQTPSRPMGTARRTGRPARARPMETAAALPTTVASRLLIVALDGKWTPLQPVRDGTQC